MAYPLEQFCTDCREAIRKDPGNGGREVIRDRLAELLKNQEFTAAHCAPERARGTSWSSPFSRLTGLCARLGRVIFVAREWTRDPR